MWDKSPLCYPEARFLIVLDDYQKSQPQFISPRILLNIPLSGISPDFLISFPTSHDSDILHTGSIVFSSNGCPDSKRVPWVILSKILFDNSPNSITYNVAVVVNFVALANGDKYSAFISLRGFRPLPKRSNRAEEWGISFLWRHEVGCDPQRLKKKPQTASMILMWVWVPSLFWVIDILSWLVKIPRSHTIVFYYKK